MKKQIKKLALTTEKIVNLTATQLHGLQGGSGFQCTYTTTTDGTAGCTLVVRTRGC